MSRDVRNEKTEVRIKGALLQTLSVKPFTETSVSELAHEAQVSRTSIYTHFGSLEGVFRAAVNDVFYRAKTLKGQLKCPSCTSKDTKMPFCALVREEGEYWALTHDAHFLPTALDMCFNGELHADLMMDLQSSGWSQTTIEALIRFQKSGCYAAACVTTESGSWDETREALDVFIRGGLNALRNVHSSRLA